MEEKYFNLHKLTLNNEQILKDKKCLCIYCKKEFDYKEINDFNSDSDGLTAICPNCGIDCVLPKENDGYLITTEDLDILYDMYF